MPFICVQSDVAARALALMRDRGRPHTEFRPLSNAVWIEIAAAVERSVPNNTPVVLVFILRAGLAALDAMSTVFPNAAFGFVGLERQEEGERDACAYYGKIPITPDATYIVIDPMFATGKSMTRVLVYLVRKGIPVAQIRAAMVIAAPEAFVCLEAQPWGRDVPVYGVALDRGLDEQYFIVPGLGDYGNRWAGTGDMSGLDVREI